MTKTGMPKRMLDYSFPDLLQVTFAGCSYVQVYNIYAQIKIIWLYYFIIFFSKSKLASFEYISIVIGLNKQVMWYMLL